MKFDKDHYDDLGGRIYTFSPYNWGRDNMYHKPSVVSELIMIVARIMWMAFLLMVMSAIIK